MKIDLNDKITRFVAQEYVNQICNFFNINELNWDVHKLIHTFMVVSVAKKLIKMSDSHLSNKVKTQILNAAVLHDIGRCHEFKKGVHQSCVDHGKIGAALIHKNLPNLKIEALTTKYHNSRPSINDPKLCQPVLDYVRDADMLANIQYEIEHMDIFMIHIHSNRKKSDFKPIIDDEIIHAVHEKRSAFTNVCLPHNLLTLFLGQLCWFYNLRTSVGKKYAIHHQLFSQFREVVCQQIVPLLTKDRLKQNELKRTIRKLFPDKLFQI